MNRILSFPLVNFHLFNTRLLRLQGPCFRNIQEHKEKVHRFYSTSPSPLTHAPEVYDKLDLGENLQIRYKVVGHGPHTVLCLPGVIGSIETDFAPIFESLEKTKEFTVVSWDPPGYGYSRPPVRDFSGDYYYRDAMVVSRLMNKLGYNKYSVLGWSNGGVTGTFLASVFPQNVTKLVMWGTHSYTDDIAVLFAKTMGNLNNWSEKMKAPMLKLYGEEYLQKMLTDWGNSVEIYHKNGSDAALQKSMTEIQCPALIIHGELDPVLGIEHAEHFHHKIKNSVLKIFPRGKHNLHLRFTNDFLELVVPFLLKKEDSV